MAPLDTFVIAFIADSELRGYVDAALRGAVAELVSVASAAELRRLLVDGPAPGAIVADTYDAGVVALVPALPWVWIADPRRRFDRGVVLAPDHLDELPVAVAASTNLARCELALRLFRRRPNAAVPGDPPAPRTANDFEMHFQPRWSIDGARLVGAEALLRWHGLDPNLSAERLISGDASPLVRLGDWVLGRTLTHLRAFRPLWPSDGAMTLNVSGAQLADPGFAGLVEDALRTHVLPPAWLELDVDVGLIASFGRIPVANLHALRASGIGLVADGVGFGAFDPSRLAHLPFSALKLDRQLVAGLPSRPHAVVLARRLVELAHRLSLSPVAVGVETPEQLEVLQAAGCRAFQGFLLAEPMPPDELAALLAAHRDREALLRCAS